VRKLKDLLGGVVGGECKDGGLLIKRIKTDSRKVEAGDVFIAYEGVFIDGHDFIESAINKGAVVVVGERKMSLSVPYFQVEDGRLAWARMVSNWYGNPERKLKIIGVTGTDGKTTTVNLIYSVLRAAGKRTGMVSTINAKIGKEDLDTGLHTTSPDPDVLWRFLNLMVEKRMEYAVLEVTSHALEQKRFGNIKFDVGVLTNLTHDHLELHGNIQKYMKAKGKLFEKSEVSVLNFRSNGKEYFKNMSKGEVKEYDWKREVRKVVYSGLKEGKTKQRGEIRYGSEWLEIETNLLGDYNWENILAAGKVSESLGIRSGDFKEGVEKIKRLKGRLELIKSKKGINVMVDFAHTENALKEVIGLVKEKLLEKGKKIIVVFGCNGEKDRSKRALMGRVACELADTVIVTTEDPRRESVDQIFEDIERGCVKGGGVLNENYFREDDREKAIKMGIEMAKKGDWVLCLGKGHEQSMNIDGVEESWDEVEKVKEILREVV